VKLTAAQVAFHEAHPGATAKEVFEKKLAPPPEPPARTLAQAIAEKMSAIETYDGDVVNRFVIRFGEVEIPCWFDREQRSTYKNSIASRRGLLARGITDDSNLKLFIAQQLVSVPVDEADVMLDLLQDYADNAFIATETHKVAVAQLADIAAVDAYDHTAGYPEKLTFNL
jgi:hypothetical protein